MSELSLADIWPNGVYEIARDEMRARVIALKQNRRLQLTEEVTLVFENRETLRFQLQEMLRAEGITSPEGIQAELNVYNPMMPNSHALAATLFIEVTEESRIAEVLHRLVGLEETVLLCFGTQEVGASFEPGRSDGQRISAVQYVQFRFDDVTRTAFLGSDRVELVVNHIAARARVPLSSAALSSLKGDLTQD